MLNPLARLACSLLTAAFQRVAQVHFIRSGTCQVIKWVAPHSSTEVESAESAQWAAAATKALNHDSFAKGTPPSEAAVIASQESAATAQGSNDAVLVAAAMTVSDGGILHRSKSSSSGSDGSGGSSSGGSSTGFYFTLPEAARTHCLPSKPGTSPLDQLEPIDVCVLGTPQYFGEIGLVMECGHAASVVTSSPVELLLLTKEAWRRLVPGRTRGAMVEQMLGHAQTHYRYRTLGHSVTVGLADESPGAVSKQGHGGRSARSEGRPSDGNGVAWPQLLPLYLPSLVQATAMGLLIPVLPLRALSLTSAESVVGALVSGRGTGLIVGGPVAGFAIARIGLKDGIVAGLLLSCMSAMTGGVANSVGPLLVTRIVAGVGLSFFQVGRQMYVSLCIPTSSRGMTSSLIAGITRLGTTIGPAVGGVIAETFSTSAAFWLEGLLFACAAMAISHFLQLRDGELEQGTTPAPTSVSTKAPGETSGAAQAAASDTRRANFVLSATRDAVLTAPVPIFLAFVRATRELLLPLKAAQLGATSSRVGTIMAVSFAVDTALVPVAGFAMDRLGRKYAAVPALAISSIGMAAVSFCSSTSQLLAAGVVLGLGNGMSNGWIQTVGADLAPPGARAQFLGMWNLGMGVGTTAGPLVIGAIAQWQDVAVASFAAALVSAAGALWYTLLGVETLAERDRGSDLL